MKPWLTLVAVLALVPSGWADDIPGTPQTIEFVQKLQTPGGGFLAMAPAPNIRLMPTLRTTSTAARALHYLGGKIPNPDAAKKFIASCQDAASGGFADSPGGKVEVATTAVGIMTVRDLGMPLEPYIDGAVKYLSDNAKSFEEIRIAAAAFEGIERPAPKRDAWLVEIKKLQNPDGTFGKGAAQAREIGSAAVILLRLGDKLDQRDNVLKALRDGQRPNGGFGKGATNSDADLETAYRVMRCFMMLKEKPARVEALRTYIAKCRNEDGGYGPAPGETSTVGATYFATIIRKWLD
jgi:prenyltransferase beta subunit